jgi:hypothetical protein
MMFFAFTGCSKKPDVKPDPIFTAEKAVLITQTGQNRWSIVTVTTTDNAGTVKTTAYTDSNADPFYLVDVVFNANGTANETDFGSDMAWSLSGNNLVVTFGTGSAHPDLLHATITKLDNHNMEVIFNDHLMGFRKVVCVYSR